jgi:PAS domain S-box-containing protein
MDVELLNQAFKTFTTASKSLESYYGVLQEKVAYLTNELEKRNNELSNALADVEKNKDYLNAVLFSLEEAIIVVDQENSITMINRSAEELLGIRLADVAGKPFTGIDFSISREDSDTLLKVNGKTYTIILSNSQVVDSRGKSRGSVILIKDITRLRDLEVQQERNQRLIAMGEMAAKLVHEIRNPLCSIELFSSMLEKELEGTGHQKLAHGITSGISSLNTILTNMLFFARPHKPLMKSIRLNQVIEETSELCAPLLQSRNISFSQLLFESMIAGDAELLKQVFMNIIINAVQSVDEGAEISVEMKKNCRHVIVDISDNGMGIRQEHLEKVFDPFFSTKDTGTGLGLAIASRIMQGHKGYIRVTSEEGKGSKFSLYFPLADGGRESDETDPCC